MLIEKDIKKIFSQLAVVNAVDVPFDGSQIMVRLMDNASKLSLTALIYEGSDYIPPSVRSCLSRKSPFFNSMILTSLTVDEQHFQIRLQYLGQMKSLTQADFKQLLEDFGSIAEKWRLYLDDHDKNDLVYVRAKS
jgi:hypothetical protein